MWVDTQTAYTETPSHLITKFSKEMPTEKSTSHMAILNDMGSSSLNNVPIGLSSLFGKSAEQLVKDEHKEELVIVKNIMTSEKNSLTCRQILWYKPLRWAVFADSDANSLRFFVYSQKLPQTKFW